MSTLKLHSSSEARTVEIGRLLGARARPGDVIALWGGLGAGKTVLARGIARGLGVPEQVPITSPTFTLINEYMGRCPFYHLDLYRLGDPGELETLPWREVLFGAGVAAVEWPERMGDLLPEDRLDVEPGIAGDQERIIVLTPVGNAFASRLEDLARELGAGDE